MDRGDLVSDEIVLTLVENAISTLSKNDGFILDGFPRTIIQAQKVSSIFVFVCVCLYVFLLILSKMFV
jgi:adenylate kinase